MKQKLKKIFENAVWWSGVVMVGLILGLTIQFVKAWTEPTVAPPNGNVGAPVNTSLLDQAKAGGLGVLSLLTHGFQLYNNPDLNGDGIVDNDVTGKVLTAQNANGAVVWAAVPTGSGGGVTMLTDRSSNTMMHGEAAKYCYNLSATAKVAMNGDTTTVYTDWRMPTTEELAVFENTVVDSQMAWTATPYGAGNRNVWLIYQLDGGGWLPMMYDANYYARCVR